MIVDGIRDTHTHEQAKRIKMPRASERVESCCSYTWNSTCATNKWFCHRAGQPCRKYHCFLICVNQLDWLDWLKSGGTRQTGKGPHQWRFDGVQYSSNGNLPPVKGRTRRLPKRGEKRAKVASWNFDSCANCFMCHDISHEITQYEKKEKRRRRNPIGGKVSRDGEQ